MCASLVEEHVVRSCLSNVHAYPHPFQLGPLVSEQHLGWPVPVGRPRRTGDSRQPGPMPGTAGRQRPRLRGMTHMSPLHVRSTGAQTERPRGGTHEYRARADNRPRRTSSQIVVGVDGSSDGRSALRWAAIQAGRTGQGLRIVTAFGPNHQFIDDREARIAHGEHHHRGHP